MRRFNPSKIGAVVGLPIALLFSACVEVDPGQPDGGPSFVDEELMTEVQGFVFDPEAMFISGRTCGSACRGLGPELSLETPHLPRTFVTGARVDVVDGLPATKKVSTSAKASDNKGIFTTAPVLSRDDRPYFLMAHAESGRLESLALEGAPPIPDGSGFVPTVNLRPMPARYGHCSFQPAPILPSNGMLEAISKAMSAAGTPTTVQDLLDPARFGGVAIIATQRPIFFIDVTPADGITLEPSAGTVFDFNWAAPDDASVPVEVKAIMSQRGFVVSDTGASPIGIAAVVVPPGTGEVTITVKDPVEEASSQRPWTWPAIRVSLTPGAASFTYAYPNLPPGTAHLDIDYDPWPWPWMCQQETMIEGGY